jgi:ABC-type lipoprotein release transport system permease subunit
MTAQIIRRVALGCGIGIAAYLLSARVIRDLLYGVSATDPIMLGATCALLILVALLATWIPARRAASIDPMQTLRAE